jgi:hypothetical protein
VRSALTRASPGWAIDACGLHFTDYQPKKCILGLG